MALILMIPGEGRMNAGFRRQVWCRRTNRLHAGFLVIRDDGHRAAWLRRRGAGCLQDLDLFVNAQDLRHFGFELRITALEIVTDLVWLDRLGGEDLADGTLGQIGEAGMASRRSVFARMASQEPRRPQLMGIAEILGFLAGQRHKPCLGLGCDRRLLTWAGTIIQRRHWTEGDGPLDTALDGLMMHPQGAANSKERPFVPISQKHARPLDPARRFGSRSRNRHQLRQVFFSNGQLDHKPRCCHDAGPQNSRESLAPKATPRHHQNRTHMIDFIEIAVLVTSMAMYRLIPSPSHEGTA